VLEVLELFVEQRHHLPQQGLLEQQEQHLLRFLQEELVQQEQQQLEQFVAQLPVFNVILIHFIQLRMR
jgi:hypothetical protein